MGGGNDDVWTDGLERMRRGGTEFRATASYVIYTQGRPDLDQPLELAKIDLREVAAIMGCELGVAGGGDEIAEKVRRRQDVRL